MRYATRTVSASLAALIMVAAPAAGQCDPFDFNDLPVGSNATNVIPGVTVYAVPGSCGGPGSVQPLIVQPGAGGSRALGIQTGCPDFSDDWLRLVFDEPQTRVWLLVGEQAGAAGITIETRAYDDEGDLVASDTRATAGAIDALVELEWGPGIARIEVQSPVGWWECIDDLRFAIDPTPPVVEIDSPFFSACACDDTDVLITGTVDDPDGVYVGDELWMRPVTTGASWTFVRRYSGPVTGTLYSWDTTGVPEGLHYLRITGRNSCGEETTEVTTVHVDRSFGRRDVHAPSNGETVCGVVSVKGTIDDPCGIEGWLVAAGRTGNPLLPIIASGTDRIVGGELAAWDTRGLADGSYVVRVSAEDTCGHLSGAQSIFVLVNNSASGPCGCLSDLNGDGGTGFADLQILLQRWGAC